MTIRFKLNPELNAALLRDLEALEETEDDDECSFCLDEPCSCYDECEDDEDG